MIKQVVMLNNLELNMLLIDSVQNKHKNAVLDSNTIKYFYQFLNSPYKNCIQCDTILNFSPLPSHKTQLYMYKLNMQANSD